MVEDPRDIVSVEKTGEFSGRYHVLQGALNPIEGIGPDQLRVRELLVRVEEEGITEVILCTNPNLEGEATAMYLARLLKPMGLTVTRIASGLPVGGRPRVRRRADPRPGPRGPARGGRLTGPAPSGRTWGTMRGCRRRPVVPFGTSGCSGTARRPPTPRGAGATRNAP